MRNRYILCVVSGALSMSCGGGLMPSLGSGSSQPPKEQVSQEGETVVKNIEETDEKSAKSSENTKKSAKKDPPAVDQDLSTEVPAQGGTPKDPKSTPDLEQKPSSSVEKTAQMRSAVRLGVNGPQAAKFNETQKNKIQVMLDGVCDQANGGQEIDIAALTAGLISFKLAPDGFDQTALGGLGDGLAAGGDLAKAIKDLVDAAIDADVEAILKAVQDIVDAV